MKETVEQAVARHYGDDGLLRRILAGLEAKGADLQQLHPDELAPVEEFHIGGRRATEHAVAKMALRTGQQVLDVGCGIGGAARYIATQTGCRVSGIDLTPEYILSARKLTEMVGLDHRIAFEIGSALAMPFSDSAFDAVITLHVAMNIADRAKLYREIARVMKPGATLCLFDVMRNGDEPLDFPVPWAQTPETSFLETPETTLGLLADAGFVVREIEDRTEFALNFFRESMATANSSQPFGIHLVMGATAQAKFRNTLVNLERGCIAPVQMLATKDKPQ